MALKVVGTGTTVAIAAGAGSTSIPIALQSGYIRIATTVASHVGIATTSSVLASRNDILIPTADSIILKEKVASSVVSSASTGTTTTYTFKENAGNPFTVGNYVTITGSSVANYNCTHALITAANYAPGYESVTVNNNTNTGVSSFTGTADIRKSVVVTTFGSASSGYAQVTEVQISSQA